VISAAAGSIEEGGVLEAEGKDGWEGVRGEAGRMWVLLLWMEVADAV
jgi:hypothetical protein